MGDDMEFQVIPTEHVIQTVWSVGSIVGFTW